MNIFTIYFVGVFSFFSPCMLPMIPVYFYAMMEETPFERKKLFLRGLLFCTGFISIFILMGLGVGGLSSLVVKHKMLINLIAGIIILILALDFLDLIKIPILQKNYSPKYSKLKTSAPLLNSFILGLLFALTWSPCIGAVLGGILTYVSAVSHTATKGALYLFIYGLGVSTPLLIGSVFFDKLQGFSTRNKLFITTIKKILGLVLILFSLTLFSSILKFADVQTKKELEHASKVLTPNELPIFLSIVEPNCTSCKKGSLIIEELKKTCGDKFVEFREVDVKNPNYAYIAIELGIIGTPTYIIIDKDGQELIRYAGEQKKETLNEAIKKITGKDCV